jgi:hypothetical protein
MESSKKFAMNLPGAVILEEFFAASLANSVILDCDTLSKRTFSHLERDSS